MNDQIQQIMMYPASRFLLKAMWYLEGFKTATHRSIVNNKVMYTEKNTSWKIKTRLQKTRQKISPRTLLGGRGIKSPSPMTGLVSRRMEVSTSAMARQRIKTLWDFFNSFLSRANTRMVSVFPRILKVERVQLVIWDVVSPPSIVYFDRWSVRDVIVSGEETIKEMLL